MADIKTIIFDDFHSDPDQIRQKALQLDFSVKGPFPGLSTPNVDAEHWLKALSGLLNMTIEPRTPTSDVALFRLADVEKWTGSDIHYDLPDWAGICYLTPKKGSEGGTAFFKHLETGLERYPTFDERVKMIDEGLLDAECPEGPEDDWAFQRYFAKEGWDRNKWEKLMVIPYKYNRAAFYDAKQFHTIDSLAAFRNAKFPRLTHNFFFNRVLDKKEG